MHETNPHLLSDFHALAMAIEEGTWNDDDPRAQAIVLVARTQGVAPTALAVFDDQVAPAPVRERAFAAIAGRVLASA
ncbi:MAG TPA: hypothetical protein VGP37_00420 [Candidatus Nanopelagicales bacterium]|nr:hypothetical protein [Candidatus Nanopelagicales bacterium]